MSSYESASLLNRAYDQHSAFPQFLRFPPELRRLVWLSALQTRRLIRVTIEPLAGAPERYGFGVEYTRYATIQLAADGFQLMPALSRVNAEARQAALEFYRVRMPCYIARGVDDRRQLEMVQFYDLLLNPEYDILWFSDYRRQLTLATMLHKIAARDPRGVGLCNMAVTASVAASFSAWRDDQDVTHLFGSFGTRNSIREVYVVREIQPQLVRQAKKHYNDPSCHNMPSESSPSFHHQNALSQVYTPIAPRKLDSFELLPHDPRPIQDDLARLFISPDYPLMSLDGPAQFLPDLWETIFSDWGLDVSRVQARVLIMCRDESQVLSYAGSSQDTRPVQRNRSSSSGSQIDTSDWPNIGSIAVGFWLFPLTAFSSSKYLVHPRLSMEHPDYDMPVAVWDVSDSPPELALFHLTGSMA
ncbi:hypothetical protein GGR57DRAFT_505478 [Xylariaceae sp. FL1272]|nr:hypothetical protein GGR57DRAFT_505478 [Xylariaceae sp. FL1272]